MRTKDQLRRYVWLIDQAKKNRFPNAKKLAEKFEIHPSQAQREITEMRNPCSFDAPLEFDYSEKGYFLENHNFQIPGVWIKDEELLLFAMAKEILKDKDSKKILDHFMEKIGSGHSSMDIKKIKNHIYFKGTGEYFLKEGILRKIINEILQSREIEITYAPVYSETQPFSINVTPIYLIFYKSNWYLLGKYHEKFRTYSLSRITEVKSTGKKVNIVKHSEEIRESFNESFGIFLNYEENTDEIILKFSKHMSLYVQNYFFHPEQEFIENEDGTCTITFTSFLSPELTSEILKYGDDVKVIGPEKLKSNVIEKIKKTLEQY